MGLQGPSVSAVMSLNVSQPPTLLSGMSPRPQPPLQRIRRPMVGTVETREEVDCTLSHIKQLRQKEKQRKREAREARREHRKNMCGSPRRAASRIRRREPSGRGISPRSRRSNV